MVDDLNFEGLKKAYAEMVLKASEEEAAERLIFGERRCLCNFKITEAETRSLNQQMKIDELEAQLSEAEEIIVDLREQLRQVQDQLEIARENYYPNKPLKEQIPSAHELINESVPLDNEKSYVVNEYDVSDQKSISLDQNSDGVVENKCGQPVTSATWATESNLIHYQPNKEIYLYKNGCTERVCATESNPFIELPPSETGHTLNKFQSENSDKKLITNNPICFKLGYSDQSWVNLQSEKTLENANHCENAGDKPYMGFNETHKNDNSSQNELGEQVVHERSNYKAQESRSGRRSPGKNARYREAISILRRSCRKKPSSISWQKPKLNQKALSKSVEVPIKVIDKMPKTEVDKAFVRENLVSCDIIPGDSSLVDVPIIDGSCNQHCSDIRGKVIKFTFYRKRRKNVLTNIDNVVFNRSA